MKRTATCWLAAGLLAASAALADGWKNPRYEFGDAGRETGFGERDRGTDDDGEGRLSSRAEERMKRLQGDSGKDDDEGGVGHDKERDGEGQENGDKDRYEPGRLSERAKERMERLRGTRDREGEGEGDGKREGDSGRKRGGDRDEDGEREGDRKREGDRGDEERREGDRGRKSAEERAIERMQAAGHDAESLNRPDGHGVPLLHHAVLSDWPEMVEYLLEQGADPNVTDRRGRTALELADKLGRKEIARILEKGD